MKYSYGPGRHERDGGANRGETAMRTRNVPRAISLIREIATADDWEEGESSGSRKRAGGGGASEQGAERRLCCFIGPGNVAVGARVSCR